MPDPPVKPEILELLGIDPEHFYTRTKECKSVYKFESAVVGGPTHEVRCRMLGSHTRHKGIYHGFPHEWED